MARTPWNSLLAQRQIIDVRRRRPAHAHMDEARIVHLVAQAGMGLELLPVRQIDRAGGDVIDGGAAVGTGQRHPVLLASCAAQRTSRSAAPARRLRPGSRLVPLMNITTMTYQQHDVRRAAAAAHSSPFRWGVPATSMTATGSGAAGVRTCVQRSDEHSGNLNDAVARAHLWQKFIGGAPPKVESAWTRANAPGPAGALR